MKLSDNPLKISCDLITLLDFKISFITLNKSPTYVLKLVQKLKQLNAVNCIQIVQINFI